MATVKMINRLHFETGHAATAFFICHLLRNKHSYLQDLKSYLERYYTLTGALIYTQQPGTPAQLLANATI